MNFYTLTLFKYINAFEIIIFLLKNKKKCNKNKTEQLEVSYLK